MLGECDARTVLGERVELCSSDSRWLMSIQSHMLVPLFISLLKTVGLSAPLE